MALQLCQRTGYLLEAHNSHANAPAYRRGQWDGIARDEYMVKPGGVKVHVGSWDTMARCLKYGFDILEHHGSVEVTARQ